MQFWKLVYSTLECEKIHRGCCIFTGILWLCLVNPVKTPFNVEESCRFDIIISKVKNNYIDFLDEYNNVTCEKWSKLLMLSVNKSCKNGIRRSSNRTIFLGWNRNKFPFNMKDKKIYNNKCRFYINSKLNISPRISRTTILIYINYFIYIVQKMDLTFKFRKVILQR